jgi:hypothetical protein
MIRALSRTALVAAVAVLALALPFTPTASADGGKAKNAFYTADVKPKQGSGRYTFVIDSSPIIFYLGTVNRKYHVLLIRVKNDSDTPLKLSGNDTIQLHFSGDHTVQGFLNLRSVDPATWDGLESEIRTAVAYPEVVPPREEEGIYFYVPIDTVTVQRKAHTMPHLIEYNIKSLPDPVYLQTPVAAA